MFPKFEQLSYNLHSTGKALYIWQADISDTFIGFLNSGNKNCKINDFKGSSQFKKLFFSSSNFSSVENDVFILRGEEEKRISISRAQVSKNQKIYKMPNYVTKDTILYN